MNKIFVLLSAMVFFAGCVADEKNSPFYDENPDEPIGLKLKKLGFSSYGIDESQDRVFGDMVLLGMNLSNNTGDMNRQVWEGFKALYNHDSLKQYYLIELSDDRGAFFFASRGDDMRAFAEQEINETEWEERNEKTMKEFQARINPLLDPSAALIHTF